MIDYQAILDDPEDYLSSYSASDWWNDLPIPTLARLVTQGYIKKRILDPYPGLTQPIDLYDEELERFKVYEDRVLKIMQEHIRISKLDSIL